MKRIGKKPFRLLDQEAIRNACCKLVADKPPAKLKQLLSKKKPKTYISLAKVTINCGYTVSIKVEKFKCIQILTFRTCQGHLG